MTDVFWTAFFAALPATLIALAGLVATLRNSNKVTTLKEIVDGKFSEMISAVKDSSKNEGKIETIEKMIQSSTPVTTVIRDRRTDKMEDK